MAIYKRLRKSGPKYQAKLKSSDGMWITQTFDSKDAARKWEGELKLQKLNGNFLTCSTRQLTVVEFFNQWFSDTRNGNASAGWRKTQVQMFRDYVGPILGNLKLQQVTPNQVQNVLSRAADMNRGPSMRLHIYNLMHKLFGDAVELYEILARSPVIKKLRPKVPQKESKYLNLCELEKLLQFVKNRPYGIAIWLQVFAGLRVGEVQYLRWEHIDLEHGILHIQGTYLRREKRFQYHPKGKKWHRIKMPPELHELLHKKSETAIHEHVVVSGGMPMMGYDGYIKTLKRYCRELQLTVIPTHGLRHSTSELYMAHGASRDDLRILFGHSSERVTDRYVHDRGQRLHKVAGNVILFPMTGETETEDSPKFPQQSFS